MKKNSEKNASEKSLEKAMQKLASDYRKKKSEIKRLFPDFSDETLNSFVENTIGTKEEFIDSKIKDSEDSNLKSVENKFQKYIKKKAVYQQRFIELFITENPQEFEKLKLLAKPFASLFGKERLRCDEIVSGLLNDMALSWSSYLFLESTKFQFDSSYKWGAYKFPMRFLSIINSISHNQTVDSAKTPNDVKDWLAENANEASLQEIVKQCKLIENIIYKTFHHTSTDKKLIIENSLVLLNGIYDWCEENYLEKDWSVKYIYFFLNQFNENPSANSEEVEIPLNEYIRKSIYINFAFEFKGWWTANNPKAYKAKITNKFKEQLNDYLNNSHPSILVDKTKSANPHSYDQINWLVTWNKKNFKFLWEMLPYIEDLEKQSKESALDTLRKSFALFKKLDLPIKSYGKNRKNSAAKKRVNNSSTKK